MNIELTKYTRKELPYQPKTDYEVLMRKLEQVTTALSPLRFLLTNYTNNGTADTDANDLICLGTMLGEQIDILEEAHEILELMPKPKYEQLH